MSRRAVNKESKYQGDLILRLRDIVEPNGYVINFDGSYIQGFPDILILYKNRWAALECKRSSVAEEQPNQGYYVNDLNRLSFASFIWPAIEDEVIDDLLKALRIR